MRKYYALWARSGTRFGWSKPHEILTPLVYLCVIQVRERAVRYVLARSSAVRAHLRFGDQLPARRHRCASSNPRVSLRTSRVRAADVPLPHSCTEGVLQARAVVLNESNVHTCVMRRHGPSQRARHHDSSMQSLHWVPISNCLAFVVVVVVVIRFSMSAGSGQATPPTYLFFVSAAAWIVSLVARRPSCVMPMERGTAGSWRVVNACKTNFARPWSPCTLLLLLLP